MNTGMFSFFPIGYIRKNKEGIYIQVDKDYKKGLTHIEKFSHIHVFAWTGAVPGNKKPKTSGKPGCVNTGCFASLTLHHPVPIMSEIVKIKSVEHSSGIITIDGLKRLGAFPVIDIKPYMPVDDVILDVVEPEKINLTDTLSGSVVKTNGELEGKPIGRITKVGSGICIEIFEEYRKEMKGLDAFSHMQVLWFFDRFDKPRYRRIREVNPPYEGPVTGVFATRSPVRPNPVGLTNVKIKDLDLKKGIIEIWSIDAFHNSPVLDITPYVKKLDCIVNTQSPPWQAHWPAQKIEVFHGPGNELLLKNADIDNITGPQEIIETKATEIQENNDFLKKSNTKYITITGARQNNLKNIDVKIPVRTLTVITGLSGSGKSSLAFDTLYAEGRRRYMQSLSSSSRQTAAIFEKPDFDHIENLLPAIAIEQKTISRNPRSTVGTISDIYNYLRLLFVKFGTRHCVTCGRAIKPTPARELAGIITSLLPDIRVSIFSGKEVCDINQITRFRAGTSPAQKELHNLLKEGYEKGLGYITLLIDDTEIIKVCEKEACPYCEHLLFPLHTSLFSYNSPEGMCPECNGLGKKQDIDVTRVVDPEKSLLDGGSVFLGNLRKHREKPNANWMRGGILALAETMGVDLELPWKLLPDDFKNKALYGTGKEKYSFTYHSSKTGRAGTITRPVEGIVSILKRFLANSRARSIHENLQHFLNEVPCDVCKGERLGREGRSVTLGGKRYPQAASSTIKKLCEWMEYLPIILKQGAFKHKIFVNNSVVVQHIFQETKQKLRAMMDLGLHYLTLDRPVTTISGGEAQRIRLSSQMGCGLSGILYVLDEPSIGLHARDHGKIIDSMKKLKNMGNTVIVVEHDIDTMREADHIIDLGPGAGVNGGDIVAAGTPEKIKRTKGSITGEYLSGRRKMMRSSPIRSGNGRHISIKGARLYNLKNISACIPLGCITCITGVSGSGKSSLVRYTLVPAIKQKLSGIDETCGPFDSLTGLEFIDKIIQVDQSPIGKSSRSNPATYIGLFDEIRSVFASTEQAKMKKYKANRFSFNSKEGQCSECKGLGQKKIEMIFLPDVWFTCRECKGSRYNDETLGIYYNGKNIAQVLEMDVSEAYDFFIDNERIKPYLHILKDVGLSYIKLGQSAVTFSGGEAQRIKLALELRKPDTGKTLFVLDEPTCGLHPGDIRRLLDVLHRLVEMGNSVILIEHNLDVIRNADWVIDLGPEGGPGGGNIIAAGTPEDIMKEPGSYTGKALTNNEKHLHNTESN